MQNFPARLTQLCIAKAIDKYEPYFERVKKSKLPFGILKKIDILRKHFPRKRANEKFFFLIPKLE